jgi:transposase
MVIKMANRRITFTEEQIAEIDEARKSNQNKNTERRLCVLSMKAQRKTLDEIVARTGYSHTYARSLVTKYFVEGIESIIGKKRKANRRNISFEEEEALVNGFAERAKKGELITVKDIKTAYETRVGHKIGSGHIYMILKRQGWRKIKPRPEHPKKASEAEIEASKKLTLALDI